MAFIPNNKRLPLTVGPSSSSNSITSNPFSSTNFAQYLNNTIIPSTFNTNFQLHVGLGNTNRQSNYDNNNNNNGASGRKSNNNRPSKGSDNGNSGNNNGNRGGRPHKNARNYNNNNSNGDIPFLPYEERTSSISFNSGIKSGTTIDPHYRSDADSDSRLFLLAGSFFPTTVDKSKFSETLKQILFYPILTSIQKRVNYRSDQDFSEQKMLRYFESLCSALQLFYCVDSVVAYSTDVNNLNPGMANLRSKISADILSQHENLRRMLLSCPIPRNLISFIAYAYQTFKFSENSDSPLYKLEFRSIFHDSSLYNLTPQYYDVVIGELMNDTRTIALLNATFKNMRMNELIPSCKDPIYDENFMSMWYNSNTSYIKNGKIKYRREVNNQSQTRYYGHFCENDVDGIFFSACTFFNIQTGTLEPGLWVPIADQKVYDSCTNGRQKCSLLCYDSTISEFIAPGSRQVATQSGLRSSIYHEIAIEESYGDSKLTGPTDVYNEVINVNPAAKPVQKFSLDIMNQATTDTIRFLFGGMEEDY